MNTIAPDEQTNPEQSTRPIQTEDSRRVFVREGFHWDGQDAYLFDIDGTLLLSHDRVHYNAFADSVRRVMGLEIVLEGVTVHGSTDPAILRDAFGAAQIDVDEWKPQLEKILEQIRQTVSDQQSFLRPYTMPGVEATLLHLKNAGAILGLATGNLERIGWLKVEAAGLKHWFTFGGFSDRYDIRAEMIAHAAEVARSIAGPVATVCIVGDTPWDISAAKANSLPSIAVATGHYSFEELMADEPDVCAVTLEDLLRVTALPSAAATNEA